MFDTGEKLHTFTFSQQKANFGVVLVCFSLNPMSPKKQINVLQLENNDFRIQSSGKIKNMCPLVFKCLLILVASADVALFGTQLITIDETITSYLLFGSRSKKSICLIR